MIVLGTIMAAFSLFDVLAITLIFRSRTPLRVPTRTLSVRFHAAHHIVCAGGFEPLPTADVAPIAHGLLRCDQQPPPCNSIRRTDDLHVVQAVTNRGLILSGLCSVVNVPTDRIGYVLCYALRMLTDGSPSLRKVSSSGWAAA